MSTPRHLATVTTKVVAVAFGVLVAGTALAGCQSADDYSGYGDESVTETGGDTTFYDSGSITTTEDGELIYSDSSGNGFSTGG
jgi:hypothetical protein